MAGHEPYPIGVLIVSRIPRDAVGWTAVETDPIDQHNRQVRPPRPFAVSPLGHLAGVVIVIYWRGYVDRAAWLCVAGAFLPDLIDKPLGLVGLTPSLHTIGHSVFVAGLIVAAAGTTGRGGPLAVGWLSHLALDLPLAVPIYLDQYVWPLRAPAPTTTEPLGAYVISYATSGAFVAELLLGAGAVALLVRRPPRFVLRP